MEYSEKLIQEQESFEQVMAEKNCLHICISDCRREGCNCDCGERHTSNE